MFYKSIVGLYETLGNTSQRLEKTSHISQLIKDARPEELKNIILLSQGKIFPPWEDKKIGVASKLVIKAISKVTGISDSKIENEWKKQGDLGNVAQSLISVKKQSSLFQKELTIDEVISNLKSLASEEGKGSVESKISIISDMLIHSTPTEAKYIVRTVLDNLRIGVGSGSMRDAIIWAFFSDLLGLKYNPEKNDIDLSEENRARYNEISGKVQLAYDICNDFAEIAILLKKSGIEGLDTIKFEPGKPSNVMLYQKAKNIQEAFEIVGKPAAFEFKYDGFRMAVHKKGTEINIFTRRLENVTEQFPDVIRSLQNNIDADSCILEGEAVGLDKEGKYVPFQNVSERIRRKYDIEELSQKFPMELNLFDIIYYNGKSLITEPFKKRRKYLESIVKQEKGKIVLSKQIITSDEKEAKEFYELSLKLGEEGVMAKNLDAIYKPGARVGYGIKIKPVMEPLDLVIIGAEWGEGKRSGWLTSYYLACSDNGELKEIGKVSTGLKEIDSEGETSFRQLSKLLEPLIMKSSGKIVELRPEIVIEVGYEEIQKSVSYSSGYALRFPRFLRLRNEDKSVEDINSAEDVERLFKEQRGRIDGKMRSVQQKD